MFASAPARRAVREKQHLAPVACRLPVSRTIRGGSNALMPSNPRLAVACSARANGNAAPRFNVEDLDQIELNGKSYVSMEQAQAALDSQRAFEEQQQTIAALEKEISHLKNSLKDASNHNAELRQKALEDQRNARAQLALRKDFEEEVAMLRMKVQSSANDAAQARKNEQAAVEIATAQVENQLSLKYAETRDRQLTTMEEKLRAAADEVQRIEAAMVSDVQAAKQSSLDATAAAIKRVGSEATAATNLSSAQAVSAQEAAAAAAKAASTARTQQSDTAALAQQLFDQAGMAHDRAAAAHSEAVALQQEVRDLRADLRKAIQDRNAGLFISAQRQADAVITVRQAQEACEHRINEMHNAYEGLKHEERNNARRAREDADHLMHRCNDLEHRERQLVQKENELKQALAQACGRASAAEEKLRDRAATLAVEHRDLVQHLRETFQADFEGAKAELTAAAEEAAQAKIEVAKAEAEEASTQAAKENADLHAALKSANEAQKYWQTRCERAESVIAALEHDVRSVAKALPDSAGKLKLSVETSLMRQLLYRTKQSDDAGSGDEWLPPSNNGDRAASAT